jgi:hypothetical protein
MPVDGRVRMVVGRRDSSLVRWWRRGGWAWGLPLVVAVIVKIEPHKIETLIGAMLGLGLVVLTARRPQTAILVLVSVLPFQIFILSYLFKLGMPASLVRDLGYWKEGITAGLVVAAFRKGPWARPKLDYLAILGLLYIGIVLLYRLAPHLMVHPGGAFGVSPPTSSTTLNTALRNDTEFVVAFLAARRIIFDPRFKYRFALTIFIVGVIVAGGGIYEYLFSNSWNTFAVKTIGVPNYEASVLKYYLPNPDDIRVYTTFVGHRVLRIGSFFVDEIGCGFFLIMPLAVAAERLTRGEMKKPLMVGATGLIVIAILLTQTRAAILGAFIVIVWSLRSHAARDPGPLHGARGNRHPDHHPHRSRCRPRSPDRGRGQRVRHLDAEPRHRHQQGRRRPLQPPPRSRSGHRPRRRGPFRRGHHGGQ